jgi:hypothetical protein
MKSVHNWQKILLLNTVSVANMLFFYNFVFPVWHFCPHFRSWYSMVQSLRCSQWQWFIMCSGLGQRIAWYRLTNVLGEYSGCLHRQLEDKGIMPSRKPQDPQISLHCPIIFKTKRLNLNILLFQCIVLLFSTNQHHAHIRQKSVPCCGYITFLCEQKQVGAMLCTLIRCSAE